MEITFRAVIELLGKPKEHVEETLNKYLDQIDNNKELTLKRKDIEPAQEQEGEMFSTFAEVEIQTNHIDHLLSFCFNYMPSMIEVIHPKELKINDSSLTLFFTGLLSRLHQVDMVAKQAKSNYDQLAVNMNGLLKNYITILLQKQPLTAQQLSNLTGVGIDTLGDFLDMLIDQGRVDLDGEHYIIKEGSVDGESQES